MKQYLSLHRLVMVLFLLLSILACTQVRYKDKTAMGEITAILQSDYEAHMRKNAALFVLNFSDSVIDVQRGKISMTGLAKSYPRFQSYFDNVNFINWDDEQPPIIRFSDDSSMVYTVVKKLVAVELKTKPGIIDTTHFAWTAIYKRTGNHYKLDCITSTQQR